MASTAANTSTTAAPASDIAQPRSPNASLVLEDGLHFITLAMQSISQDEFSKCFEPDTTHPHAAPQSLDTGANVEANTARDWVRLLLSWWRRTVQHGIECIVRYCILFPARLCVLLLGTVAFVACLPLGYVVPRVRNLLFLVFSRVWMFSFGGRVRYHGNVPRPDTPHLFVSNHTSIIDYFVLSAHQVPFATVAQQHAGLMGYLQTYVLSLNGSLMFRRADKGDRSWLMDKMREHVSSGALAGKPPLLVFPEGTCVNNEFTVLFQRGAFSLGATVCPVAIKYDKRFGDPFWMSSRQSFLQHIFYLMTRFALVADVWFLPPETARQGENSAEFARRVKEAISLRAGLTCLSWDGYMKNSFSDEKRARLKSGQQHGFAAGIRRRLSTSRWSQGAMHEAKRANAARKLAMTSSSASAADETVAKRVHFPDHLSTSQIVDLKNQLMMAALLNPVSRDNSTLASLAERHDRIIETWKKFTRIRERADADEKHARRVENSAWRLWFRDQNLRRRHSLAELIVHTRPPKTQIFADNTPIRSH